MIVVLWIGLNLVAAVHQWDPYPFILLNLVFSTQAAYAAPLILLSQNCQADTDRIRAEHGYQINQTALKYLKVLHTDAHGQDCRCIELADRGDESGEANRVPVSASHVS